MQRTEKQEFTTSRGTRFMGISLLLGIPTLLIFSFLLSPADDNMDDAVRLIYVHVPMAIFAYVAIITTGIGSVFYLWKNLAGGTLSRMHQQKLAYICGLVLVTGSIWGRPTWNTWWEWEMFA